jgi:hypothetical protein
LWWNPTELNVSLNFLVNFWTLFQKVTKWPEISKNDHKTKFKQISYHCSICHLHNSLACIHICKNQEGFHS